MTATARTTGETILFVEGSPPSRRRIRCMIQGQGYQLLEASNGHEALGLATDHRGPIELLVTDVVMPRMGGFTLGERLVESHPETRVLFLSGYADRSVTGGLEAAGQAFLLKPFTLVRLLQTIREQLDIQAGRERDIDRRKALGRRRSDVDRRQAERRVRGVRAAVERREKSDRRSGGDRRSEGDRRTIRL